VGSGDQDGPFEGLDGLVAKLSRSERFTSCMAAQTFEFLVGRPLSAEDACEVARLKHAYDASAGDLRALVQAVFTSDAFARRF
jgi:uncharacterized protein (DUF1800 family)